MERDAVWQAFADTGDPLYYLLYKQMRNTKPEKASEKKKKDTARPGELPRPED